MYLPQYICPEPINHWKFLRFKNNPFTNTNVALNNLFPVCFFFRSSLEDYSVKLGLTKLNDLGYVHRSIIGGVLYPGVNL
jgi:hypothetical protein